MSDEEPTKEEHLRLSGLIKGVHSSLRQKFKKSGNFEEVWQDHCKDETLLAEYADAMHRLAETHWANNQETRIDWCRAICLQYFYKGGLQSVLDKDDRKRHFDEQRRNSETHLPQLEFQAKERKVGLPSEACTSSGDHVGHGATHSAADLQVMLRDLEMPAREDCCRPSELGMSADSADDKMEAISDLNAAASDALDQPTSSHVSVDLPSSLSLPQGDPCHRCRGHQDPQQVVNAEPCADCRTHNPQSQEGLARCQQFVANQEEFLEHHLVTEDSTDGGQMSTMMEEDKMAYPKYEHPQYNTILLPFKGKMRLLDVGSCFNAFLRYDQFLALGIDISPAVESVYKCDFLHLEMTEPLQLASDTIDTFLHNLPSQIDRLPRLTFHVVVFSLLLEYFPSPYQRWLCCQKAHELLMQHGLLLVITPDSSHVHKNANMIRSWRTAIESLGFIRWRYEKLEHLHCMAFRKVSLPVSDLVGDTSPDMLYIPQDFTTSLSDEGLFPEMARSEEEDDMLRDNFLELPDSEPMVSD